MLSTFGLRDDEIALFNNFYKDVASNFKTEIVDDLNIPFQKFELFKHYHHIGHRQTLQINDNFGKAYLAIIQVEYTYTGTRGGSHTQLEFQVWGFAFLSKSFGHVYIRPETLTDKAIELFNPLELDFPDDKSFSKRFYVLSNDRLKTELLLDKNFRTALKSTTLEKFQLEISDKSVAIGENKNLANCNVKSLGNLLLNITNVHL